VAVGSLDEALHPPGERCALGQVITAPNSYPCPTLQSAERCVVWGSLTFVRTDQADAARLMHRPSADVGLPSPRARQDGQVPGLQVAFTDIDYIELDF